MHMHTLSRPGRSSLAPPTTVCEVEATCSSYITIPLMVYLLVDILHSAGLRLTEKHITRLLRQLKKHASKWREIGINLEFLPGELANIAARPNLSEGAPVSLLGALLEEWIQWAPGDSRGSTDFATLESLKTALSDSGLGVAAHDLVVRIQEPRLGAGLKSDNDGSGSTCKFRVIVCLREPLLYMYVGKNDLK